MRIYSLKWRITSYSSYNFSYLKGFEQIVGANSTTYYLVDSSVKRILLFDEYWQFKTFKTINDTLNYIKAIGKELYISGDNGFYKTDQNINILLNYSNNKSFHRGIYYNETSDLLYVSLSGSAFKIRVFNRNLTLMRTIATSNFVPYSLNSYMNTLFVGTKNGSVLVLENETIKTVYNDVCEQTSTVSSILIDEFGYMAVTCYQINMVHLYNVNGANMNISIPTAARPFNIAIDSHGRLIINTPNELDIYY